ncbi:hypothetical protein HDV01_004039, partial [Terramyces sp. JEL0728]
MDSISSHISKKLSEKLDDANIPFNTNIQELVITAMALALTKMDGVNNSMRLLMEGHGREPWSDDLDISRTIGWFTSIYPVRIIFTNSDKSSQLKLVKQALRTVPNQGISFMKTQKTEYMKKETGITFNYLGRFQAVSSKDSYFTKVKNIKSKSVPHENTLSKDLLITAYFQNQQLHLNLVHSSNSDQKQLIQFLEYCKQELESLILFLVSENCKGGLIQCDYPLLDNSIDINEIEQAVLDMMEEPLRNIQDVYPTSPLQQGLIYSMLKSPDGYVLQKVWKLENVDVERFIQSWNRVSELNDILRTGYVLTSNGIVQVVFKNLVTPWIKIEGWRKDNYRLHLNDLLKSDRDRGFTLKDKCFTRFHLAHIEGLIFTKILETNQYIVLFTQHHSICDATSSALAYSSLIKEYLGEELEVPRQYRDHIQSVLKTNQSQNKLFWSKSLEGYEPKPLSIFEKKTKNTEYAILESVFKIDSSKLSKLLQKYQITSGSLIRAVWGLCLYFYQREDIVFGSVFNGRETGAEGVD